MRGQMREFESLRAEESAVQHAISSVVTSRARGTSGHRTSLLHEEKWIKTRLSALPEAIKRTAAQLVMMCGDAEAAEVLRALRDGADENAAPATPRLRDPTRLHTPTASQAALRMPYTPRGTAQAAGTPERATIEHGAHAQATYPQAAYPVAQGTYRMPTPRTASVAAPLSATSLSTPERVLTEHNAQPGHSPTILLSPPKCSGLPPPPPPPPIEE
eukprot:4360906-Pleurochrysis_carterae.AAC.1